MQARSGRPRIYVVALTLVLIGVFLSAAPAPAQDDLRDAVGDVVVGSMTYKERGPGASYDGIANALLVGAAAPAMVVRMGSSMEFFFEVLENPLVQRALPEGSMSGVSDMLNSAADLPELPIAASYDAHISFKLRAGDDGVYRLESGILDWSTDNTTSISYEDASITDSFHGRGFEALDPEDDKIELQLELDQGKLTYTLDIDVGHQYLTDGRSLWTTPVSTLTLDKTGTDIDLSATTAFGMPFELPPISFDDLEKSVLYLRHRTGQTLSGVLQDRETWSNVIGGHQYAEFTLAFEDCSPEIASPLENEALVFDHNSPAKLDDMARLSGVPEPFEDGIHWVFPSVPFDETYDPADMNGGSVDFTYEGLRESNGDFGEYLLEVEYLTEPLQDLCDPTQPRPLRIFFPKDGENNPEGIRNWFYYWLQTDARSGIRDISLDECTGEYGYYGPGSPDIHLCHPTATEPSVNKVDGAPTSYIDTVAVTVLHEDRHRSNWNTWGSKPKCTDTDGDGVPDPAEGCIVDSDGDTLPDDEEAHLLPFPLDPHDPTSCQDINGKPLPELDDEHCLAYWVEINWPIDSVDEEDWASPGSQDP